tara:strand:- start:652 stop:900 length:249 start_codon:yes stop_codon:yes gene_type:complete
MATQTGLTVDKIVKVVKEKWAIFGVCALTIFILQLLSTKILISIVLGAIIAYLLPSEVKTIVKKASAAIKKTKTETKTEEEN